MLRVGDAVGRWRLTERLGPTAFAGVDVDTDQAVVVKAATAEALACEVEALEAVRHPHLVRLVGHAAGIVVTARVLGPSLGTRLAERGGLPWPVAASVLAPVAEALAALHCAGWVHGDVSPSNVVLGDAGAVLIDLGRARPVEVAGPPAGTPGCIAPEVEAGNVGGPEADVWSLAAVVAEAVTGAPCPALAALPPGAALALGRALAADPTVRPTALELAAALRAAAFPNSSVSVSESETLTLEFGGDAAARITRDYGPRPPARPLVVARPRRRRTPVAAVLAMVAAGLAVVALRPDRAPAGPPAPTCAAVPSGGLVGDPDGDGCDVAGHWAAGVLTIAVEPGRPPRRYALGGPGDLVALGDWDCDGDDTPGLYRSATGVVTLFDTWPATSTGSAPWIVTTGDGLPDPECGGGTR